MKWWAYIHSGSGTMVVRRYFATGDIRTADKSPYIRRYVGPFYAPDKETAKEVADSLLKESDNVSRT